MSVLMRSGLGRAVSVLGGSGLVAAGVLVAAAGPASAQALTCGSTVDSSVTLTANINCTSDTTDNALTITASGVTVNLNGHSILGPGPSSDTEGINDTNSGNGGYGDVTVENGTISNFETGIDIEGDSSSPDLTGVLVRHVTINQTTPESRYYDTTGVYGSYLSGATIQKVTTNEIEAGVGLENSQDSTVTRDHVTDPFGVGIYDEDGDGNTISGNSLTHAFNTGIGVGGSTGDVVQGNTFAKFCDVGIAFSASDTSVTGNTINDCYMGIEDEENTGDTVSGNHGTGNLWGIIADDTTDETYSGNTFSGGEYGIETDCPAGETLTGNTANGNSQTGVYVYTAECNSGTYSATLSGNTANHNRYGLYADIATSGAGNHAAHNKVVNCYNVTCVHSSVAGPDVAAPPHNRPVLPKLALPARF